MRLAAAAAIAIACLWGCAPGYSTGDTPISDSGPLPAGGGTADGGKDAGADAGTDAGTDAGADAGCVALNLNGVSAVDGCHGGVATSATGTVNLANCTLDITLPSFAAPCTGTVSGAANAFSGTCESGAFTCTSPSLPGVLSCTSFAGGCQVTMCDGGAGCP